MRTSTLVFALVLSACSLTSGQSPQQSALNYTPVVGAVSDSGFTIQLPPATVGASLTLTAPDGTVQAFDSSAAGGAGLSVAGLQPDTTYAYQVNVAGQHFGPFYTHTFPRPDTPAAVNIAVLADHDSLSAVKDKGKPLDVYPRMLSMHPDALLQIGDFPHFNPAIYPGTASLENWRLMHRTILAEAFPIGLSSWTPPFTQAPDDHDAAKNDAALGSKAQWRQWMLQAHDEVFPTMPRPSPLAGLWTTYRVGRHVQVIQLDERSQKDGKQTIEKPGHSMLGSEQKAWFKQTLLDSTATWKIVISTMPWQLSIPKEDGWYGFQYEHAELTAFIAAHGIRNVVFVSGDNHCGYLDNGTFSGFPEVNVPGTNTVGGCSSGFAGFGSHGVIDRPQTLPAGAFAWLAVSESGSLTARLIRADGVTLHTMSLYPQ